MGRPSKLTPETQKKLVEAISAGNFYETACTHAGIEYQTFRNWMKAGEQATNGRFFDFFEAITRAEAEAEMRAVEMIRQAMPDDWRAAVALLERRHPDRWGRKERIEHAGQVSMQHGVSTGDLNAVLAALGYDPLGTTLPGGARSPSEGDRAAEEDPGGGS